MSIEQMKWGRGGLVPGGGQTGWVEQLCTLIREDMVGGGHGGHETWIGRGKGDLNHRHRGSLAGAC